MAQWRNIVAAAYCVKSLYFFIMKEFPQIFDAVIFWK